MFPPTLLPTHMKLKVVSKDHRAPSLQPWPITIHSTVPIAHFTLTNITGLQGLSCFLAQDIAVLPYTFPVSNLEWAISRGSLGLYRIMAFRNQDVGTAVLPAGEPFFPVGFSLVPMCGYTLT